MIELFKHQSAGVEFILNGTPEKGCGALFWDIGTGKTIGTLSLFKRLREATPALKLLVVCPISLIEGAWAEDVSKFMPGMKFQNLHKYPKIKGATPDIVATNYEEMRSLPKQQAIKSMIGNDPWMCVLDESSKIKNFKAQTTRALLELAPIFKHRVISTGTPAPNSAIEYWPQMQFVQRGIFHPSFFAFRNSYFYLKNRYTGAQMPQGMKIPYGMAQEIMRKCDYDMTNEKRAEMMREISKWAHFAKKKECLDLPETMDEVRKITMSGPQRSAYKQMKQHLILELKDSTITAQVAISKILKLRQICAGFIYDEHGTALDIPEGNAKLNELADIIEQAGDQQIIVWIQFHWEMDKICAYLAEQEIKFSTLYSGTKDRDQSVRDFKDGSARILVAHPRSAMFGLTFVGCHLQVFFSVDYSFEGFEQARGRTDRPGQKMSTTYIYLQTCDSIDEDIYKILNKKSDNQELLCQFR